jgi:hypothetical protein
MTENKKDTENSLTAPLDRNPDRSYIPNQGYRSLTEDEVSLAMKENNNNSIIKKFLSVERKYCDPVEPLQRIGLVSFVPAKGAIPDSQGIYGFAKLRGNFQNDVEASEKAEFLIRNVDSYQQIYHAYVGRPFPLTVSSKFSGDLNEIDLKKSMVDSVSNNIKVKKNEEQKQIKEIEEREKMLKEDVAKDEADPIDTYTTLKVKKAQVTWTYIETKKKLDEMKDIIIKTSNEIKDMDNENKEFSDLYFKKYCEARKESGLNLATNQENFMKFLVEDSDLSFDPSSSSYIY